MILPRHTQIGRFIAGSLMLACAGAFASPFGLDVPDYRGSQVPLVTGTGFKVTERDLLLFTLCTALLPPREVRDWRTLPPPRRAVMESALELQVSMMVQLRAKPVPVPIGEREFLERWKRVLASRAAMMIWVESVVKPSVRLFPEDYLNHLKRNPNLYVRPEVRILRRLRVPTPPPASRDVLEAARIEAGKLREEAIRGGGLEPILARQPTYLIDPPGQLSELSTSDMLNDPLLMNEAGKLALSQVSEPVRTSAGYILLELVDVRPAQAMELPAILPQLEADLRGRFLPQQFDYLQSELVANSFATNRSRFLQFLPDEADLVRVRDFAVTATEFRTMFAEAIGPRNAPNRTAVNGLAADVLMGEAVTQALESNAQLGADEFYNDALDMAERIILASRAVRAERDRIRPTPEEVQAHLEKRRAAMISEEAKVIWQLQIYARDQDRMTRGERDAMRILLQRYGEQMLESAQRSMNERREVSPERALAEPDRVLRAMPPLEDERARYRFERVGTLGERETEAQLGFTFSELEPGRFTPIQLQRDGTAVSYFVSETVRKEPPTAEAMKARAEEELIAERSLETIARSAADLRKIEDLVWAEGLEAR